MADFPALYTELQELRRELMTEIIVLRTALGAVIPYLSADARHALDKALRKFEGNTPDGLEEAELTLAVARLPNALLPIHRPGWDGKPPPPNPE